MKTTLYSIRTLRGIAALVALSWLAQCQPATAVSILLHGDTASTPNDDQAIEDHLNARYGAGSVNYMAATSAALDGSSANGFDLIVISESVSSSDIRSKYEDTTVPLINWENAIPDDGDGEFQMSEGKGTVLEQTQIVISETVEAPFLPLTAGLSGTVTIFSAGATIQVGKGELGLGVAQIATSVDDDSFSTLFAVDVGGALLGDGLAPEPATSPETAASRRVMFPLWRAGFSDLNDNGIKLFNASIDWLLDISSTTVDGDYDNDGFVGQSDLDLVLLNWGSTSPPAPAGWINEVPTGLIGQGALDGVLLNWGAGTTTLTSAPEPTSALLLSLAGALCCLRRR